MYNEKRMLQTSHVRKRFKERHCLDLHFTDLIQMREQIKKGIATCICTTRSPKRSRGLYKITLRKKTYKIWYDFITERVITVYP